MRTITRGRNSEACPANMLATMLFLPILLKGRVQPDDQPITNRQNVLHQCRHTLAGALREIQSIIATSLSLMHDA